MKKLYILAIAATLTITAFAQRASNQAPVSFDFDKSTHVSNKAVGDTIYGHLGGTPTVYISTGGGYVGGQNEYGDLSKMQKFDASHGLTSTNGTIENLLLWFGHVEGNPASTIKATIWADNAGSPGNILGTVAIPYQAIDTVGANLMTNGIVGWNAVGTFSPAIAIPASQVFWAGIEVTYAPGDTVGLITNTDGDFADAVTHTYEEWSDNSFVSFNDGTTNSWQLDVALAAFPVMNYNGVGIEESNTLKFNVYPNPSDGLFNINLASENSGIVNLSVKNVVGQTVLNKTVAVSGQTKETISLVDYSSGIYFLTIDNQTVKLIVE